MSTATDSNLQTIGWNGITLSCPRRWETIITKATHLLFEENFKPVFELRWHEEKRHSERSIKATLHKIAEETGLLVQRDLPPHWEKLQEHYALKLLADSETKETKAAIMICKECGTTLLLYFFHPQNRLYHRELTQIIHSIHCHQQQKNAETLWAIQDFKVLLPEDFTLSGHNFGAGLTRLSFVRSGLTIHLCRIAGAAQRLERTSMLSLLNLLGDLDISEEQVETHNDAISHCSSPSILQQIRSRLKRKAPFHQVILRHHPEYDRLSGLFFFDKKPIPETLTTSILESYEIFSL